MKALPGPNSPRPSGRGGRGLSFPHPGDFLGSAFGGEGYVPQPRKWLIPVVFGVPLLTVAWLCDVVSAWLGTPTHYVRAILLGLAALVGLMLAAALAFYVLVVRRAAAPAPAPSWPAAPPRTTVRATTVTATATDLPRRPVEVLEGVVVAALELEAPTPAASEMFRVPARGRLTA
jgi:hypothetical protein